MSEQDYTPGSWRHSDWCQTPTGHAGDCWVENKRAQHVCNLRSVWPIGHPLPPIMRDKRQGPEEGSLCIITGKYRPGLVVRVVADSYVWSPGECRHNGGTRNYDWSVIDDEHGYRVVVNDSDLLPITPGMKLIPSDEEPE